LQRNRLLEIGLVILALGAAASLIGGIGEVGYIQCVANSASACTSTGNTQYITVFLADSELLSIGISVALIGAVILIGGSITNYVAKLADELKATMAPLRVCPKCGAQVAATSRFCGNCGNSLGQ
jgi:zinc-ribbon domain